ncbi:hypothetical protein NSA23_03635 [Anaerosalibacter massiliensis]|uniref:Uncharacterized protein n=1 Tax=Anaerosalibacter massiliensis TaxID=1347392 RepID=A0A9X2MGH9_9FIRM|nr:hypothetical protein [Anaerosalibacter massiliensis]MCR2043204.1 hypothetical protein [Anaerosalibacter massiliensis]
MTIREIIKYKDIDTYRRLQKICRKKKVELGDRVERLMQHDSYRRQGRRIRQVKWG